MEVEELHSQEKQKLRKRLRHIRQQFMQVVDPVAMGENVLANLLHENLISFKDRVGGYWPKKEELDPRPCLYYFWSQGNICGLPVIETVSQSLSFRQWQPSTPLIKGPYQINEPFPEAPPLIPTIILMPLLAFDQDGYRLGQGKGHYDRMLEGLRLKQPICAIGLAYDCQKIDRVPRSSHDQRLDYVITPTKAWMFSNK